MKFPAILQTLTLCATISSALATQREYTLDGSPTPLEEEIRWLVNRGHFDSARENQTRGTSFTDIPATDGPLAPHHSLTSAARRHSEDMARNNMFQHATVPGSAYYNATTQPSPWDRFRAEGYTYSAVAENIAAGYGGAEAAYVGWWKSGGHRRNMCGTGYREIGNGQFHWASSTYRNYYTMTLGGRSGQHFLTDTMFHDANGNRAYNQGEGVAGIRIWLRLPAAAHQHISTGPARIFPRSHGTHTLTVRDRANSLAIPILFWHISASFGKLRVIPLT